MTKSEVPLPLLVLDNYDSFTYNLVQYLGELGADPVVKRNDEISVAEIERLHAGGAIRGVVISPGPCTPNEAGVSVELIRQLSGRFPILGVCLGHQSIGAAFGGEIVRAPAIRHGKTSEISHDGKGVYRGLPDPFTATRYHSLCIRPESMPESLIVTSTTHDELPSGQADVIMGVRHRTHPTEGVQFHPESILTEVGHQLLGNFLDIVKQVRA